MGRLEKESRQRARKNELKALVLETIKTAGLISVFLVAPNVIGAMAKIGLLPSPRQKDIVNRSCDRMVQAGLLTWKERKLRLTPKGEAELRKQRIRLYDVPRPRRWDRKWRMLIFDIPEYRKNLRKRVRDTLRLIGFVRLQDSVWVYPHDCEDLVTLLKADFKIGKDMLYIIADAIEQDSHLKHEFELR